MYPKSHDIYQGLEADTCISFYHDGFPPLVSNKPVKGRGCAPFNHIQAQYTTTVRKL